MRGEALLVQVLRKRFNHQPRGLEPVGHRVILQCQPDVAWCARVFIALFLVPTRRSCLAEGPERPEYLGLGKSRQ